MTHKKEIYFSLALVLTLVFTLTTLGGCAKQNLKVEEETEENNQEIPPKPDVLQQLNSTLDDMNKDELGTL